MDKNVQLTKRFVIDMLGNICFHKTIHWDGNDQFNQLPILSCDDDKNKRIEQRGAILEHDKYKYAFKLLITAISDTYQQVCYRITNLDKPVEIDDQVYNPMGILMDLSFSNVNLGIEKPSSLFFSDNSEENGLISTSKLFMFLEFLIHSKFIAFYDKDVIDWELMSILNYPPIVGDSHFKPVYEITNKDVI